MDRYALARISKGPLKTAPEESLPLSQEEFSLIEAIADKCFIIAYRKYQDINKDMIDYACSLTHLNDSELCEIYSTTV
jgi:hypothetical protein